MYAVIKTGGKQYKVAEGERLDVERLRSEGVGEVSFTPVLVVDGSRIVAAGDELAASQVTARVVGDAKGPKIRGFTYKNKTNQRRRWGHRQKYTTIEITGIRTGGTEPGPAPATAPADAPASAEGDE
jgi:large subunit ribosomal protein L21